MNLNQFFAILRARWWVAALVLGLTVVTTLVVSLLLPKRYTAQSTLVVNIKTPDPIAGMMFPVVALPQYMATQVDIIESDRVAARVVRDTKLADNPQVRQQWQDETGGTGSIEGWLAGNLKRFLSVKPSRESNVITVGYTAQDPRFASAMANAFVRAYLDTSVDLRTDPARQYVSFFDQRAKQLRAELEKAQSRLSAYQREHGIFANDERLDVETTRLNELAAQLVQLQSASADSSSRSARSSAQMQEVLNNPVIANLQLELSRAQAHLQELGARLGANHPQLIEARANVKELQARIGAETRRVMSSVHISNQVNQSRESEVQQAMQAQRAKVLALKQQRDEASVLQRDVENAQRAYDAVMARGSQTSLESQTTQSDVSVLSQAAPPPEPSSPKVGLNTLLSIVVGGLLAVVGALLVEMLDRRVRTAADATEGLGLPLLGTLPGPKARRHGLGSRRSPMPMLQQRILGQLPNPSRGV